MRAAAGGFLGFSLTGAVFVRRDIVLVMRPLTAVPTLLASSSRVRCHDAHVECRQPAERSRSKHIGRTEARRIRDKPSDLRSRSPVGKRRQCKELVTESVVAKQVECKNLDHGQAGRMHKLYG